MLGARLAWWVFQSDGVQQAHKEAILEAAAVAWREESDAEVEVAD